MHGVICENGRASTVLSLEPDRVDAGVSLQRFRSPVECEVERLDRLPHPASTEFPGGASREVDEAVRQPIGVLAIVSPGFDKPEGTGSGMSVGCGQDDATWLDIELSPHLAPDRQSEVSVESDEVAVDPDEPFDTGFQIQGARKEAV